MRTALLLGIAVGTLLLAGPARAGHDDGKPRLDYGAPSVSDTRVYTGYPDRVPSEVEYRRVEGTYDARGRWTGTWNGTYETPDGRRYDGTYEGTVESAGTSYDAPPPAPYYGGGGYEAGAHARYDREMERRCGRGGTVGGAVVGGAIGGLAGNRIAGKGNRTEGTIIGGALGAVAGGAIGSEADRKRCDEWHSRRVASPNDGYPQGRGYPQGGNYYPQEVTYPQGSYYYPQGVAYPQGSYYYPQGVAYPQGRGYPQGGTDTAPVAPPPGAYAAPPQGYTGQVGAAPFGYGQYTPGVVVTTYITHGAPVVTETVETSTRTYYENVPVRKRSIAKKKWKPKPKPRCVC